MQGVSTDYLQAIVANERKIKSRVVISFVDNETVGSSITPVANEHDPVPMPKELAINTVIVPVRKFALADTEQAGSERMFPGEDLFPAAGESLPWVGAKLSDAAGDIGTGGEDYTIEYGTPVTIEDLAWFADDHLGNPVNFEVFYDAGAGFISIIAVTGYTEPAWTFSPPASILNVEKLKITITKVSIPGTRAKMIEFQGGFVLDVTDRVVSWEVAREREINDASAPVGNASISDLTLNLDNTDRIFYKESGSIVSDLMIANRKITIEVGPELPDGTVEFLPVGTYFTVAWNSTDDAVVTVSAWDRAKRAQEEENKGSEILIDQTISELVLLLLTDFDTGLASDALIDITIDEIPFSFFDPEAFWIHFKELAIGEGGQVYFNELGQFVFEARDKLTGSPTAVTTLRDSDTLIAVSEGFDQQRLRNKVIVKGTPLIEQAQTEVLNFAEVITVPGSGTKNLTLFFSTSPVKDPQTPVITGHADISISSTTLYSWGVDITLSNVNVADQTITLITADGNPFERTGGVRAVANDDQSIATNGAKTYEIESDFFQSNSYAEDLAQGLVDVLSDPGALREIQMRGRPELQLGDPVNIEYERGGIDADFWIIRYSLSYDGALMQNITVLEVM